MKQNKPALIAELENILRIKLECVSLDKINWSSSGLYALDGKGQLVGLGLYGRQLTDISFLAGFTTLSRLKLSKNHVTDLSPLANLTRLTDLDLSGNRISDISPLSGLINLKELDVIGNQINDLSPLARLNGLTHLLLTENRFSDLSPLSGLTGITNLYLGNNAISDLSPLAGLNALSHLFVKQNQISDLTPLARLTNLTVLDLSRNQVSDISPLARLTSLKKLDIRYNRITSLPPQILDIGLELDIEESFARDEKIYLAGNPLEQPPPEIIRQGKEAVRAYFRALEEERERPLQEVKVLLVGDGGAGKTSLVKRLLWQGFDPDEYQTDGINIDTCLLTNPNNGQEIRTHLWDFGGQEIMHATHQFFLSRRSLYILVLDGRRDEKTEYWLKHIESFGGDSPILVVLNKIDQQPGFDVNRKFLQEKYPNIKGFFPVSCATGSGIDTLVEALRKELPQVELVNTQWPASWFQVKQKLEEMTDPYISYGEYRAICRSTGIKENDVQDHLLDFLHDLGVVLHFSDAPLEDTHVLQPAWATGAVYRIINSRQLAENMGILDMADLHAILQKTGDGELEYPKEKYAYITGLMCKFEICYRVDEKRVLLPDLLAVPEPLFDFDYEHALRFIVGYDFLPRSVLPRFIVHMYKDIDENLQWRTGVVLRDPDFRATAVVKADYEARRIYFYVSGEQRRDYFACLLFTLRRINSSFKNLYSEELLPMPDDPTTTVAYRHLLRLEEHGIDIYLPAGTQQIYKVKDLIGTIAREVDTEEEIMKLLYKIADPRDTKESLMHKFNNAFISQPKTLGAGLDINKIIEKALSGMRSGKKKNGR